MKYSLLFKNVTDEEDLDVLIDEIESFCEVKILNQFCDATTEEGQIDLETEEENFAEIIKNQNFYLPLIKVTKKLVK